MMSHSIDRLRRLIVDESIEEGGDQRVTRRRAASDALVAATDRKPHSASNGSLSA